MNFDLNDFRKNEDLAVNGVWIDFGGGAEFKLAAFDNPTFTEAVRKRMKPYADLGREVPEKDKEEITADSMARYVILDWKGVFDKGEAIEYSPEAAKRLLLELPDIASMVLDQARKVSNFREKTAEDIEGNSESV